MRIVFWLLSFSCACIGKQKLTINGNPSPKYVDPSAEARLIRLLMSRYDKHGKFARPLLKTGPGTGVDGTTEGQVSVKFGLRLIHIDLDEKEQVMRTSGWKRVQWYDEYLKWNSSKHSGITRIVMPYDSIWTPDIMLANTAQAGLNERRPPLRILNNGHVFWTPQAEFTSACLIDVTNYPFDKHTCDMWFQSASYHSRMLSIVPYHTSAHNSSLDLSTYLDSYKRSQAWDILSNETDYVEVSHQEGMHLMFANRPSLRFRLVLRRRPGFSAYLLTVPCVALSLLLTLIFCLPPERPDRHTIAMSLFASCLVLLLLLSSEAPPSAASIPTLSLYYGFNMVAIALAVIMSALVVSISRQGMYRKPVPRWAKKSLMYYTAKALCIISDVPESAKANDIYSDETDVVNQWKYLARVLDRLFFFIFTLVGIVAFIAFFPWV